MNITCYKNAEFLGFFCVCFVGFFVGFLLGFLQLATTSNKELFLMSYHRWHLKSSIVSYFLCDKDVSQVMLSYMIYYF